MDSAPSSYQIYTDGGCLPNKRGAWAFLIFQNDILIQEDSGLERSTDSFRMEFTAALQALRQIPPGSQVCLWTDSRILIETATRDLAIWKSQAWTRKSGRPILHPDLMRPLDELIQTLNIDWRWVKAHVVDSALAGSQGSSFTSHAVANQRCDELCRAQYSKRSDAP